MYLWLALSESESDRVLHICRELCVEYVYACDVFCFVFKCVQCFYTLVACPGKLATDMGVQTFRVARKAPGDSMCGTNSLHRVEKEEGT